MSDLCRPRRPAATRRSIWRRFRFSAVLLTAGALTACTTFSPDGGMDVTADIAKRALHKDAVAIRSEEDAAAASARVHRLLTRPLTADSAVQIALLNNRGLQAAYNELGIAEAVSIRQSLPPNPSISIARISGSVESELEQQIVGSILALVTLPTRREIAAERFRKAQLIAALETLRVAADARRNFYRAAAAHELVGFLTHADAAAATSAELAKRLGETGAMNKLDQARDQAFHAEVATQAMRARQRAAAEREQLIRSLGLTGDELNFVLPNALPALPQRLRALRAVEQEALNRRIDLQISRSELEVLAKSYGLTQTTRFINVMEAGYVYKLTRKQRYRRAHS